MLIMSTVDSLVGGHKYRGGGEGGGGQFRCCSPLNSPLSIDNSGSFIPYVGKEDYNSRPSAIC